MKLIPFVSTHFTPLFDSLDVFVGKIYKIERWYMDDLDIEEFEFQDDEGCVRAWNMLAWEVRDASYEGNLQKILSE